MIGSRVRVPVAGRLATLSAIAAIVAGCVTPLGERPASPESTATPVDRSLDVPIHYHRLDNGLKVVVSPDPGVPVATVAVYYNIGFRIEPRDRTGFAHLFEHMMFQGSVNLGKMEFVRLVQSNGGVMNGSTRFDYTNYFEAVPSHKLETMLWAEADRMRGLAITEENLANQKEVVKNEVKVNVLNQPYGGFPWLDMPQVANENWYNAHNFYGDLEDLDAATLDDVQAFFDTFYAPNNAVVVVVGDVDPAQTLAMVERYFGDIPAAPLPPPADISEPRQTREKTASRHDPLAPRPAVAFAYHMPERNTPAYYAMGIIDQVLLQGDDSRLYQAMVKERGFSNGVFGGVNMIGNMFNYNGPMTWTGALIHDPAHSTDDIIGVLDAEIRRLVDEPLPAADMERALTKVRSSLYDVLASSTRFGLADLLACFALFDDDPGRINEIEDELRKVTPALIQSTAREYLRRSNRTVLTIEPGAGGDDA